MRVHTPITACAIARSWVASHGTQTGSRSARLAIRSTKRRGSPVNTPTCTRSCTTGACEET